MAPIGRVRAADAIREAGDAIQLLLPACAAGMTLGHHDAKGALQLTASTAVVLSTTFGLKYSIREDRPDGGPHSFPSGHTSISFGSAAFLRERYGWKVGLPAFAAATFVGYSRVESKEHYFHDVLAGAAIGLISSHLFTRPYARARFTAGIRSDGPVLWFRIG